MSDTSVAESVASSAAPPEEEEPTESIHEPSAANTVEDVTKSEPEHDEDDASEVRSKRSSTENDETDVEKHDEDAHQHSSSPSSNTEDKRKSQDDQKTAIQTEQHEQYYFSESETADGYSSWDDDEDEEEEDFQNALQTLEGFDFEEGELEELGLTDEWGFMDSENKLEQSVEPAEEGETETLQTEKSAESIKDTTEESAFQNVFSIEGQMKSRLVMPENTFVRVFEALALSTILEELYLQLDILGHAFPGQFVQSKETDFQTFDERFKKDVTEKEFIYLPKMKNFVNPFIVDEAQVGSPEDRLAFKIQKDRAFLQEVVRLTRDEIDEKRTFDILKEKVSREEDRSNEGTTLEERYNFAKKSVLDMKKKIEDFHQQIEMDQQKRKELITTLKDQLIQVKVQGKRDARYTKAWHEAHNAHSNEAQQHQVFIQHLRLKAIKLEMKRDRFCHKNIHQWTQLMLADYKKKTEDWKIKFDHDIEQLEKDIKGKQEMVLSQQGLIENLQSTIDSKMAELGPWLEEQDAVRFEKADQLRLFYSARKIQRWWRAYMTKQGLYKTGGKKKGKKGKGGQEKKGKPKSSKRKKSPAPPKSKPKSKKKK